MIRRTIVELVISILSRQIGQSSQLDDEISF